MEEALKKKKGVILMSVKVILMAIVLGFVSLFSGCGQSGLFGGALPTVKIEYEPADIVRPDGIIVDQGKIIYERTGEVEIGGLTVDLGDGKGVQLESLQNTAAEEAIANMATAYTRMIEFLDKRIPIVPISP